MELTNLQKLPAPLLAWYDENRRVLPWREQVSPYRTWVSEIMLQQTRVQAVLPYFQRFMEAAPDVAALAALPDQQLMRLWQGLGYYSRARNLKKAARSIMEDCGGVFPDSYDGLRRLAGIGDYTAGAILSIAFGVAVPAVDGNVLRILSRVTGSDLDILDAKNKKFYRIVRKKFLKLAVKLSCKGFVVGNHQSWFLHPLYEVRHGEGLAGACNTHQSLIFQAVCESLRQLFHRLRLVACHFIFRM